MSDPDDVLRGVAGSDPIGGARALAELVALGDEGEELLFSRPLEYPQTAQATRRLLRYVASRRATVVPRLLEHLQDQRHTDAHTCALLYAGAGTGAAKHDLHALIKRGDDNGAGAARFRAWGFAGGTAGPLLRFAATDSHAWKKLATFAFRGACASVARVNEADWNVLETLVTREWREGELAKVDADPDAKLPASAIDTYETAGEAFYTFLMWRRGALADEILREARSRVHWRARDFGAQVLASLGLRRTVSPVVGWLRAEPVRTVRASLLHALERSGTSDGADAVLDHFTEMREGASHVARSAWRSSKHAQAREALTTLARGSDTTAAEALVSLARMGARHDSVLQAVESPDHYLRVNAALALAYLKDARELDRIIDMQREAARPLERIYLAAARALLGQAEAVRALHDALVEAGEPESTSPVDLFYVHRYLQLAVLDALASGGDSTGSLRAAWEAECQPLDPAPKPVDAPKSAPRKRRSPVRSLAPSPGQAVAPASGPLTATDLLLVTVNPHETRALLEVFKQATGQAAVPMSIGDRVYRDLGLVNGTRCVHALSEMGSAGPGGSSQTVDKGIRALNPKAVIFVGIAFGVDKEKQKIGDILLARQIRLYDMQRVGTDIIPRGDKVHSSTWLMNFFDGFAQTSWSTPPRVHAGLVLSADKLVDNLDYREQIRRLEPEAVGGEMEGAGLYVASQDAKVDWILIKAICDWADGHKATKMKIRQQTAAANAAAFLVGALHHAALGAPVAFRV